MSTGIRQADHPLRFWVPSNTTHGKEYLVDLAAYRQNGKCDCPHYEFRCEPELRRGALPSPLLRCTHIEDARDHFIGLMLKRIAKHMVPQQDDREDYRPPKRPGRVVVYAKTMKTIRHD